MTEQSAEAKEKLVRIAESSKELSRRLSFCIEHHIKSLIDTDLEFSAGSICASALQGALVSILERCYPDKKMRRRIFELCCSEGREFMKGHEESLDL